MNAASAAVKAAGCGFRLSLAPDHFINLSVLEPVRKQTFIR